MDDRLRSAPTKNPVSVALLLLLTLFAVEAVHDASSEAVTTTVIPVDADFSIKEARSDDPPTLNPSDGDPPPHPRGPLDDWRHVSDERRSRSLQLPWYRRRFQKFRASPGPQTAADLWWNAFREWLRRALHRAASHSWWPLREAMTVVINVVLDADFAVVMPDAYSPHIMGGQEVKDRQKFPYVARLNMTFNVGPPWAARPRTRHSTCAGALIHPRWVITAAHCLHASVQELAARVDVTLGDLFANLEESDEVTMTARGVDIHPNFHLETLSYDVALIQLPREVPLGSKIALLKLPDDDEFGNATWLSPTGMRGTTSGWGVKDIGQTTHVNTLRTTDLKILEHRECQRKWVAAGGQQEDVEDFNICYGGDGTGACFGDSGGPVIVKIPKIPGAIPTDPRVESDEVLVAVNSFVLAEMQKQKPSLGTYVQKCRQDAPNVGTSVLAVLDFVRSVLEK